MFGVCTTYELTLNISHLHLNIEIVVHALARDYYHGLPVSPRSSMVAKDTNTYYHMTSRLGVI